LITLLILKENLDLIELIAVIFNNPFKIRKEFFEQKDLCRTIFSKLLELIEAKQTNGVGEFNAMRQLVEMTSKLIAFTAAKTSQQ
jgi:hypothetical protein